MAAQYEGHVTVWRKAVVRCISLIISRFDSSIRLGAPCSEPGRPKPGPACIRSATACIRLYDPGPAAAAGGHGSTDQLPVRSLKRAVKLSERIHWLLYETMATLAITLGAMAPTYPGSRSRPW